MDDVYTLRNTYDRNGHLLQTVYESDWDGPPTAYYRKVTTNSYDAQGRLLARVIEWDVNSGEGNTEYHNTLTNTYDRRGNLLIQAAAGDFEDGDGGWYPDASKTANTFDQQGRLVKTVFEWDWSFDGILDELGTTTLTYDQRGDLLNTIYGLDRGVDGSMDEVGMTANRYDRQGNLVNTTYKNWIRTPTAQRSTVELRRIPTTSGGACCSRCSK